MWRSTQERLQQFERDAELGERCVYSRDRAVRRLLDRQVEKGVFVRIGGLYARADEWAALKPPERALMRMRALAELHPYWVFCGVSAALAYGLWVPWGPLDSIHVATKATSQGSSAHGIVRHGIKRLESTFANGLRVTPFDQTVVDCLCQLDFGDGLAIADSALRMSGKTREELQALVDELAFARPGARQARKTAAWADARAESGGESVARARMIALGYMVPDLQVPFTDPIDPRRCYRADFGFDLGGSYVVGELDGAGKYLDPAMTGGADPEEVRQRERRREARISATGVSIMRFSFDEVRDEAYFTRLLDGYGIPRGRRRGVTAPRAPIYHAPRRETRRRPRRMLLHVGEMRLACSWEVAPNRAYLAV